MGRLSKADWKTHDKADALVGESLHRQLTDDEIDYVIDEWRPEAKTNVASAGAFFTTLSLAMDIAMFMGGGDGMRCIDLCAGIGGLTWAMKQRQWHKMHYVAVEINPTFVEVGKRLMPDVEWICGSVFDREIIDRLGKFDLALSNPPFGNVFTTKGGEWLNYNGVADLQVCEIITRITTGVAMVILPASSVPWGRNGWDKNNSAKEYAKWKVANPGFILERTSIDPKCDTYAFRGTNVAFDIAEVQRDGVGDLTPAPEAPKLAEQIALF